jgi:ElaA protein
MSAAPTEELTVRRARDAGEVARAIELRTAVFVGEQGVSPEEELDGRDGEALHLVAVTAGGTIAGTCRLLADGERVKLGRMAVARERRGAGIAGLLLAAADDEARALGARRIVLASQLAAIGVYERAGYAARGDVFVEAGIEHRWMEKPLA